MDRLEEMKVKYEVGERAKALKTMQEGLFERTNCMYIWRGRGGVVPHCFNYVDGIRIFESKIKDPRDLKKFVIDAITEGRSVSFDEEEVDFGLL